MYAQIMDNYAKREPKWEPESVPNRTNTEKGDQKTDGKKWCRNESGQNARMNQPWFDPGSILERPGGLGGPVFPDLIQL